MTTRRELRAQRAEKSPKAVVRQSGLTSVIALIGVFSGLLLDLAWGRTFGVGDTAGPDPRQRRGCQRAEVL